LALEFPGRVPATLIFERIPRLKSGKILPIGQQLVANALEAGLFLYKKDLISRKGLQDVVNDLMLHDQLPDSFNLERAIQEVDRKEEQRKHLWLLKK